MATQSETLLALLADGRVMRPRDIRSKHGIPNVVVKRLHEKGSIQKVVSRFDGSLLGYAVSGIDAGPADVDEASLAVIAVAYPEGVLCLQSALRFHRMTDEASGLLHVALDPGASGRAELENVQVIRWSRPKMFKVGVLEASLGGVSARITDRARTVADLFGPMGKDFQDIRMGAMAELFGREGSRGLAKASFHAQSLGWGREMESFIQGFMEGAACRANGPR